MILDIIYNRYFLTLYINIGLSVIFYGIEKIVYWCEKIRKILKIISKSYFICELSRKNRLELFKDDAGHLSVAYIIVKNLNAWIQWF